jgi:hypothetical protein
MLINYIKERVEFKNSVEILQLYEGIKKDWMVIRNRLLKYQITKDEGIFDLMINDIQNTRENEILAVHYFINELKTMTQLSIV